MIPIRDTIRSRTAPVVTVALIVVNVLVFFYELGLGPRVMDQFLLHYGFVPAVYFHASHEQPWDLPAYVKLPAQLTEQLAHASRFSLAISGGPLLYNLMLAEKSSRADKDDLRELLYHKLAMNLTNEDLDRAYERATREGHVTFPEIEIRENELAGAGLRYLEPEG